MRFAQHVLARRLLASAAIAALPVLLVAGSTGASAASGGGFVQTNLVSDQPGVAQVTDPNLVNPWGLIPSSTGPWWVSDNATGLSTLYTGAGSINPLVVAVPPPAGAPAGLVPAPTGIVFNSGTDFVVATAPRPARPPSSSPARTAPSRAGARRWTGPTPS